MSANHRFPFKSYSGGIVVTVLASLWAMLDAWGNLDFLFNKWGVLKLLLGSPYVPLIVVLAGFGLIIRSYIEHRRASRKNIRNERVFAEITPRQLAAYFQDHTERQAYKLLNDFADSWVRLTGEVNDVQDLYPGIQIIFREGGLLIFLQFNAEWIDQVSVLNRGQTISAIGQISGVAPTHVSLSNCEIVTNG